MRVACRARAQDGGISSLSVGGAMRSPVSGSPETQFGERRKNGSGCRSSTGLSVYLIAFAVRHLPGPPTAGGHSRV
jgi:hypothetical protein